MKFLFARPNRCDNSGPNCWEVARTPDGWAVRDSKQHGDGPVLEFSDVQWAELVDAVHAGGWPTFVRWTDDRAEVHVPGLDDLVLTFDAGEMSAFADSVCAGQYAPIPAALHGERPRRAGGIRLRRPFLVRSECHGRRPAL
jgi:hypothetical protein